MKNRFIVVYSVFAALVFIFSLSFFGYNLYSEYQTNQEKSEKQFNQLVNNIKYLSTQHKDNNSEYADAIKQAIGNPASFAFIELQRNGQTVLLYPAGKTKQETTSKMVRPFENTFSVDSKNINFVCNYYLIHPNSIFYYARVSFLMILIITLITVIMIIYLNLTEGGTSLVTSEEEEIEESEIVESQETEALQQENPDSVPDSEAINGTEEVNKNEISEETNDSSTDIKVDTPETDTDESKPAVSESNDSSETTDFNEADKDERDSQKQDSETTNETLQKSHVELPVSDVKPAVPSTDNPSGLYNSETGIGWESYLISRLDNEIERATASEIDLSLFVFNFPETKIGTEEFKNICNYLTIQFQFKDLLFEHNDDSIVAIKISMDVDSAISFADKLYNDLSNIIENKKCYIGITSRSIRMVTGERLMLEAEQAVEHAIQDKDSPIIAFRVDSDKYRQMLEQN